MNACVVDDEKLTTRGQYSVGANDISHSDVLGKPQGFSTSFPPGGFEWFLAATLFVVHARTALLRLSLFRVGMWELASSKSKLMIKKGTAVKKATVLQAPEPPVPPRIVASRPSTTTNRAWIYAASPAARIAEWEEGSAGKWCVFRHNTAIDEAWLAIGRAVEAGRLPLAKASTRLTSPMHGDTHIICVYSRDWATMLR